MENKLQWATEKRKVKDLIPFEYNPRILSDERKERLIKSLEKFNLAEIPAVNLDNKIVAGHQRVKVLLHLNRGDDEIDVRIPNRMLTEEEFKEYNLTSNIPAGYWDVDILTEHFEDIDFEAIGLDVDKIDVPMEVMAEEFRSEEESDFDPEPPREPITKMGDVYEFKSLDKNLAHRLVCGDSTKAETYDKLGNDKFNLLLTDPPYNVDYKGGKNKVRKEIENDNLKSDEFYEFLFRFYSTAFEKTNEGASIYIFHADTEGANFRLAFQNAGWKLSQCLIWLKQSITLSRQDYHWKHEPILYGWKLGRAHDWYNDRKQTTVLEFDRPMRSDDHPTMKPIDLLSYLILNSSKKRDVVGDSFSGSGSTLIACEQTSRQCRAIELGTDYADVNVKRYVKYMRENGLGFEVLKNGVLLTNEELENYL